MNKQIQIIRDTRASLLEQLNDLSIKQFNQTPRGFVNNIGWNMGHLIVVQQGICYQKAGLPLLIRDDFWQQFKPGSRPERIIDEVEIANIKQLLITTLDQFETDYNNRVFGNYTGWTTRLGTTIMNIDDGLEFLSFHEKLHSGTITALKRLVI
jgi:uncharacterized damage-inducible protein DinB